MLKKKLLILIFFIIILYLIFKNFYKIEKFSNDKNDFQKFITI